MDVHNCLATTMLARILIISVIFEGVICNPRYPNLNQGTRLQQNQKVPWRNIWTTLGPPTTPKPRKLSVYDTIKAAAAASRRVNLLDSYHQRIVTPKMYREEPVFPTKVVDRYSSVISQSKRTNAVQAAENSVRPNQQTIVNPTVESRFSGMHKKVSPLDQAAKRMSAISAANNAGVSRSNSGNRQRSNSVGDIGLNVEAGMFDVASISQEPMALGHLDLFGQKPESAIALYAVDHGHDHTTSIATENLARTSNILEKSSPTSQPRFRIMPDGSIVDFGISRQDRPNLSARRAQTHAQRRTQPTAMTHARTTFNNAPSSSAQTKNQAQPTSASQVPSSTGHSGSSTSRQGQLYSSSVSQAQYAKPAVPPQAQYAKPTVSHQALHATPAVSHQAQYAKPGVSPTQSNVLHNRNTPRYDRHGGVPVDDSLGYILDDPRRRDDRYGNLVQRGERGGFDHSFTRADHLSMEPSYTRPVRLSTTFVPAQTTRRKTTTTQAPTTTTTLPTTTTPTTTTTTPKPTTTTPKDDYWYRQGGEPINITYLHDNHVCPKSRARWQDYTVYLETKPRLCMIQVTFNARYKREPIYHNTWWGQNVDWIYKTVYDPEVKVVDLHGWRGSTWYG